MAQQLMLFETAVERRTDGSFVVTPRRPAAGQEIRTKAAAKILGVSRETVSVLIAAGAVRGWKMASARGNAAWRIDAASVFAYKERRLAASRC